MSDSCNVEDSIVKRIRERGEHGRKKYGVSMDRKDLTHDEWLNHFQEELMDGIQYAERAKQGAFLLRKAFMIISGLRYAQESAINEWIEKYNSLYGESHKDQQTKHVCDRCKSGPHCICSEIGM